MHGILASGRDPGISEEEEEVTRHGMETWRKGPVLTPQCLIFLACHIVVFFSHVLLDKSALRPHVRWISQPDARILKCSPRRASLTKGVDQMRPYLRLSTKLLSALRLAVPSYGP